MTHHRSECSISILHRIVAMIPRTSILHSFPCVGERVPRSDRALSYAIDAVHMHGVQLSNSVPMDTGAVVLEIVMDFDDNVL